MATNSLLLDALLKDWAKLGSTGVAIPKSKFMTYLDIESSIDDNYLQIIYSKRPIELGQYEQNGEIYYIIFDPKNGDMEFDTLEGLEKYLKTANVLYGFNWVSDNEPIDVDFIEWMNDDEGGVVGKFISIARKV